MDNTEGAIKMRQYYSKRGEGYECGQGSTVENTVEVRQFISRIIKKYNVKSINDAPCGSFNWMSKVDLTGVNYVGFDIDDELLDINREKHTTVKFIDFNIINNVLPSSDLIICRDCLFHLPTSAVIDALHNFKISGSKFLLSTTYTFITKNVNMVPGVYGNEYGFRKINLILPPFNLGDYIEFVKEEKWNRVFALWRLN